ncbi:phage major capsid protein [Furfurilactobacillus milii]|uniref:Phage major capsid protein n=1 Tax=Furfurilactobacillus rossiae TaxID=231049 RepID=A0A7C9MM37_9LACO|nr:phage major capsid protein [Furfurilactobacillus milii]MYV04443.1 phage major capsid protein [Furfurilactobacillus milii]
MTKKESLTKQLADKKAEKLELTKKTRAMADDADSNVADVQSNLDAIAAVQADIDQLQSDLGVIAQASGLSDDDGSEDTGDEDTSEATENDSGDASQAQGSADSADSQDSAATSAASQQTRDDDDDDDDEIEQDSLISHAKGANKRAMKTIKTNEKSEEVRSFEQFLKTGQVQKRDIVGGFTSGDGEAVLPEEILDVMKVPNDPTQLGGYVNKVSVSAPTGKLPILQKASAQLVSAAELADNPAIAKASITPVPYDVQTLRGMLPVSFEMTQDYPNITSLLATYIQDVQASTEQHKIGAVLQTATPVAAKTADDLKDAFNVGLTNYGSDVKWIVSESMFSAIDKLKDGDGRYLLQDSIGAASGKTLFGADLIVVADDVLGNAGDAKAFVGSLKAFVLEAVRGQMTLNWDRNEQFEQVLGVAMRADFKAADTAAGKFVTYTASATSSTPSK